VSARAAGSSAGPGYAERLHAPLWVWLVAWFLVLTLVLAYLFAVGPWLAGAALGLAGGIVAWGLLRAAALVLVDGDELVAGRARIPVRYLGPAQALDEERARRVRGVGADPAAHHLIRPWIGTAVRVEVTDPRDPHPYWYVATRHPARLAAAITAAQSGH
jgi:hypothetical protein